MSASRFTDLALHVGHRLACVFYNDFANQPANVAVECEDCCEVLLDFDAPAEEPQHEPV